MKTAKILLSFDIEEFDLPKEHGTDISLSDGIKVSKSGLLEILSVLDKYKVPATFFCTANFANAEPALIQQMAKSGHEIACHGVDHFSPQPSDIKVSKKTIEKILKTKVLGYRQPRMQPINYQTMHQLGYLYDSSINPAFIPGRYNHLHTPRTPFTKQGIIEIPTSVATSLRVPLFWLALHLFPKKLYLILAKSSLKKTGYFTTYFHPWEFTNLTIFPCIPKYIQYNSGKKLKQKLSYVIKNLKKSGYTFTTYTEFAKEYSKWYPYRHAAHRLAGNRPYIQLHTLHAPHHPAHLNLHSSHCPETPQHHKLHPHSHHQTQPLLFLPSPALTAPFHLNLHPQNHHQYQARLVHPCRNHLPFI